MLWYHILFTLAGSQAPCYGSGMNNALVYFQVDNSWLGGGKVTSLTVPQVDPYYGWTFAKQGRGWLSREAGTEKWMN